MREVIKESKVFLFLFCLFFFTGIILSLIYLKSELVLFVNQYHSPVLDMFFRITTNIGGGVFCICISLVFLFIRFRSFFFIAVAYLSSGLIVQLFKRLVFVNAPRPAAYIDNSLLHFVEGVGINHSYSFPSGHAASVFALFLCLSFMSKLRWLQVLCFLLAFITAFSRVYLIQHFVHDISAGSLAGVIFGILTIYYFQKAKSPWIDKSLLTLKRNNE